MDSRKPRAAKWLWRGNRAAFHPDGVRALVIADRLIVARHNLHDLECTDDIIFAIEWSPLVLGGLPPRLLPLDGDRRLLVLHADGRASLFDLETRFAAWIRDPRGQVLTGILHALHVDEAAAGLVTSDRRTLVVDSDGGVADNEAVRTAWRALDAVPLLSAAWDSSGKRLIGGTENGEVVLSDRAAAPRVLGRHLDAVSFVRIDAANGRALTASEDGAVVEWSLPRGDKRIHCEGATVALISAGRTPEGTVIATTASGAFHTWRTRATSSPKVHIVRDAFAAAVSSRHAFTMREEHAIELWDTHTGVRLAVVEAEAQGVEDVAFVGDGRRIATRIGDELREWVIEEPTPE